MDDSTSPRKPQSDIPGDMPSLNPAPAEPEFPTDKPGTLPSESAVNEPSTPSQDMPPIMSGWGMSSPGGNLAPSPENAAPQSPDMSAPGFSPPTPVTSTEGLNEPPPVPPPMPEPGISQQTPAETPSTQSQETAPVPPPGEETLVIPPTGQGSNPFIPETAPPPTPGQTPANPLIKRMLVIIIAIIVIAGLAVGGYFLYGQVGGSKNVTITYWGLWENNATLATMLSDFEAKYPNIQVQFVKQSPQQYRERLQAAIARGDGPDVFEFHNTWVPMLRNELAPAPQTVTTATQFASTFYPVAAADLVGGSSVYGIPMMIDGLGLYYNTDLLTAAGVSPPTTWPELLDIVPKLTVKTDTQVQKSAIALGTTGNIENFSDIVALMMMQNGAKLVSPTGKEAEDTLTFYHKFADPNDPDYTWNDSMDNSISAFANGKVAMIVAPSWQVFDIKQMNPNLNFKVAPVPQLPGNTINWASYWVEGVSTKTKYSDAAWTFVNYLTSKDTVTKLYASESKARLFGEPYARVDLGSTLASDPYVGAFISEAPTAKSFPLASRTFDNGINDKLIQYLTDAVNAVGQGTAPTQALATMSQGFAQVLGSYGLSSGVAPTPTP